MRTLLASGLFMMLVAAAGCHNDKDMNDGMKSDRGMSNSDMAMKDDCAHCPGVQHMTTEGKCPVCGMKLSGGGNAAH